MINILKFTRLQTVE